MYRLDWIEQLKLRTARVPSVQDASTVTPTVWRLGFTSMLTDISTEMVNSMLPLYLVLYLHASPLVFGAIDGAYHGVAVALLSLAGGILADRWRRYKEIAAVGYGISTVCKLGLMAAGASWGWIGAIVAFDRLGKGARTAPRDALLSLNSSPQLLATSFAVHRALDAGGSLLGPIIAFLLMARLPGAYDALWFTSFVFGLVGVAILLLFVQNPAASASSARPPSMGTTLRLFRASRQFRAIALAGGLLSVATVSDGFVYLVLTRQSGMATQLFPLYYVITAAVYMVLSVPVGRVADRLGRKWVLLGGYGTLLLVYTMLATSTFTGGFPWLPLFLFGLYYAATEGVLMAVGSAIIPAALRTSGLAVLTTVIGLGKLVSSVAFGWLWQMHGTYTAILVFVLAMGVSLLVSMRLLRSTTYDKESEA